MHTTARTKIREVYERTARSVQAVLEDPKASPEEFKAAVRTAHKRAYEAALREALPLSRTGQAGAEALVRRSGINKEAPL